MSDRTDAEAPANPADEGGESACYAHLLDDIDGEDQRTATLWANRFTLGNLPENDPRRHP